LSDTSKYKSGFQWIAYGDLMRIYASIAVVILHTSAWVLYFQQKNSWERWSFNSLLSSACRWSVPVFVILSGAIFLSSAKNEPVKKFLATRLKRVGIPLVFWSIIYFIYIHTAKHIPFSLKYDLTLFLKGQPYYHLYFIFVIIGLYIITPALKSILNNLSDKKQKYLVILVLCITSLAVMVNKYFNLKTINAFTFFIPFIGYYLAGFSLKNIHIRKSALILVWMVFISAAIIISFEYELLSLIPGIRNPRGFDLFYVYCNPAVIIMSICAYLIISNGCLTRRIIKQENLQIKRAFRTIARATFGIYLIHPLILEYTCVFYYQNFQAPLPPLMDVPFLSFLVLIISFIFVFLIMKAPYLKNLVS